MKMGDVTEKRLSKLSRGIGTLSGNVHRETPVYHREFSGEYELFQDHGEKSLEDLLFHIKGKGIVGKNLQDRKETHKVAKHVIHKTYSTKLGTLILFADNLYLKEKKKKKHIKKRIKSAIEDLDFEGTVEDLTAFILRFGDDNFHFVSKEKGLRDERLISVRPGYSPVRYIASVTKLWKPGQVEKLVQEKALKEDHIEHYQKLKLPKIDIVPSSKYDPLLRSRPKPYSHISLPELFVERDRPPSGGGDVRRAERKVDDASSGYAKSLFSDKKSFERRKPARKKTMQVSKLELHLPSGEPLKKSSRIDDVLNEDDISDTDTNDSLSDWDRLLETTRKVVDRTFENIVTRERAKEELGPSKAAEQSYNGNKSGDWNRLEGGFSSSADSSELAAKGAEYASLDHKRKEDVISHLLVQGITNEISTIESLMTDDYDDKASFYSENKIDLLEQVSFPTIRYPRALPGLDNAKGFKGNALHGSLPSANSNKSKQSSKSGSLKDGLVISSISKLPPIKSEPATPNVNEGNKSEFDAMGIRLPQMPKKGIVNSSSVRKSYFDSEANRNSLFIGGHAIEVADVQIEWKESNDLKGSITESDGDNDDGDSINDRMINVLRDQHERLDELMARRKEENAESLPYISSPKDNSRLETPDSGLSTATGLTLASDVNLVQNDQKIPKEPMTPVVEESSRSSKASKALSREGTLNRTSASIKRGVESIGSLSPRKREETQISLDMKRKEETLIEEKPDETLSSMSRMSKSETLEVSREITTDDVCKDDNVNEVLGEEKRSPNEDLEEHDIDTASATSGQRANIAEDEGVCMEEEPLQIIQKEATDASEAQQDNSKIRTPSDSMDLSSKHEGSSDDAKADSVSVVSRRSSGLLLVQARAAAHSALSRPRSGVDLIEDMKVAADEFGKLFGEQVLEETDKLQFFQRGRTKSDTAQRKQGKRVTDKNRSVSALSTNAAKRVDPVDVNALKATIISYESLSGNKKDDNGTGQKFSPPDEPLDKEPAESFEVASNKSFAAASSKSLPSIRTSSPREIQMDIISYAPAEVNDKEKEALIQREADSPGKEGTIARERTVDTEEERFAQALNAIVEEVKELKEKKPTKKKKVRRSGRTGEEQNHIVRDVTPVSPPFLTGKAKDEKPPKGLNSKEKGDSKAKGRKGKVKKEIVKKAKAKKDRQPKKKVTFKKEDNDGRKDEEQIVGEVENETKKYAKEEEALKEEVIKKESEKEDNCEEKSDPYDKYDVPMTIKQAAKMSESESEEGIGKSSVDQVKIEDKEDGDAKKKFIGLQNEPSTHFASGISFVSSTGFETDEYAALSSNDNDENADHRRRMDDRTLKRKIEAERRRLKVEQRRREKEEAKRKQQEQAEREEKMKQEAELEMQRRIEEVKNRKRMEEEEKRRKEEGEKRQQKMLEREREKERREKEELKRKMAAMAEKLRLEEERRREQERIARELEEEQRKQEEEMLKAMEEHERIEYERKKKEEEEMRRREEEERKRVEKERRLIEEEEHRLKMQKLQEFHQMLLERAKFWEGMKNSKWFLEINQRLTRAFSFSYFDLLPAILFEFTTLRPFTPKETRFGLPTIHEERKGEDV